MSLNKLAGYRRVFALTILIIVSASIASSGQDLAQIDDSGLYQINISGQVIVNIHSEYNDLYNMKIGTWEGKRNPTGTPGFYDVMARLEKSRITPITILNIGYAYIHYDFIEFSNDFRTFMHWGLGIRLKNPNQTSAVLLELAFKTEKTLGMAERFGFYYDGNFHENLFYNENRNVYQDFYRLTVGLEF
jgi:hypothetical protein